MSIAHGERVYLDFDSGQIEPVGPAQDQAQAPTTAAFIGEIAERTSDTTNPPSAPSFKSNTTGFPAHKKRTNRVSAFKQQRVGRDRVSFTSENKPVPGPTPKSASSATSFEQDERRRIGEENRQRIAAMSEDEIEQERNELLAALSPSLVQRLLGRSNIDEGSNEQDWEPETPATHPTNTAEPEPDTLTTAKTTSSSHKKVSFDIPALATNDSPKTAASNTQISDVLPKQTSPSSIGLNSNSPPSEDVPASVHFPTPTHPPELDPSSPSFLTDLKVHYFPNLTHDPSALSWMTPIDPTDTSSPYHPSQTALNASELRFNFKGALLPPSTARAIPIDQGLHHHSEAPEAAGYTIPELARLARSFVASQRCMAYQTLGRILYRLGRGEFGEERDVARERDGPVKVAIDPSQVPELEVADEEEAGSAMAAGLWKCVEEGKVVESLMQEAGMERGHLTARTYAQEALWNWRRGGGRKRKAV
ncbi:hypothetical protein K491DRAFT_594230 [Lophiostoma macrostomum CBS 122681]|uniref:Transcription factor Rba50 n=1 Tax=Lophiostoma macrostomum CBS 122681 TaxID=1314788 RepID=A0A6A6TEE4_9PLEO|nr:hypothetical protein K491DRAFT_594230 [Lophiostoma macrostomum CBS 122681]